jgi:hypothetical protein
VVDALKILLELRPALDGHAGIPQETRLLFSSLRSLPDFEVDGLIQSSTHVLAKGLPETLAATDMPRDKQINRLSRIVVSLQQKQFTFYFAAFWMAVRRIFGGKERLTRFSATHFRDFLWRWLFAKTLPIDAFDSVTSADFRVARVPWTAMHKCALITNELGYALYPRLDTSAYKVMIVETPYPGIVSSQTRLLVRYHDAIPLLMPHTISDRAFHRASHYHALRNNVRHGAYFACVSDATRNDLISIFPEVEERAVTIHNMISPHYFPEDSSSLRVPEIIFTRRNTKVQGGGKILSSEALGEGGAAIDYLLIVSTIEPRKNHLTLLAAWERLRTERFNNLKLLVVGMLGWDHKPIVKKFAPWIERDQLFVLTDVPSPELRLLYKHARATVCPSFGEGFDFSGVESMRCGGAVAASNIAVHREIYADAAEYFSPYSIEETAQAIASIIDPANTVRREDLIGKGAAVSARYLPDRVMPQWQQFLQKLSTEKS